MLAASQKEMRDRIGSVNSTRKITEAMKLVAAAKVRKAQDAVINSRPFSESLVKILFAINTKLAGQDVDVPLCAKRTVKAVRPNTPPRPQSRHSRDQPRYATLAGASTRS